jgi:hypothetical protein
MKSESVINIMKPILFFGLISVGIDLIRKLIFAQFDLTRIFNLDFIIYEIVLEFVLLIITAILTHLIIKNISSNNLWISLFKASIFSAIYSIVSLIAIRIVSLIIGAGIDFEFDIYKSFIFYIPNGLIQGILFMLVLVHLYPKNNN